MSELPCGRQRHLVVLFVGLYRKLRCAVPMRTTLFLHMSAGSVTAALAARIGSFADTRPRAADKPHNILVKPLRTASLITTSIPLAPRIFNMRTAHGKALGSTLSHPTAGAYSMMRGLPGTFLLGITYDFSLPLAASDYMLCGSPPCPLHHQHQGF